MGKEKRGESHHAPTYLTPYTQRRNPHAMGRTVSPFSQVLSDYRRALSRFRRQLDSDEQRALDQIFESAHLHTYLAVYMASFDPSRPIFLSALLEHRKRLEALVERVDVVEREVEELKESSKTLGE